MFAVYVSYSFPHRKVNTYSILYYVPVELNSFQTLAIELVNKLGELAGIGSIKTTTLVLHFKKIL
jgi:hypothetical protein